MATKTQVNDFINKLSKLAIAECNKRTKKVLPSICIAQAAIETGWGTSKLMTKANAYFGIKATSSWKGKVFNSATSECYDGKTYTNITACFRAYDSVAESVADYYDLITGLSRYAGAVNETNVEKCITAIKNGGYATSPTYIKNVMSIVNDYNLTQYDSCMILDNNGTSNNSTTTPTNTTPTPTNTTPTGTTYTVVAGDNLTKIAKKFGTTVDAIYQLNKGIIGNNKNLIYPGQVFQIPTGNKTKTITANKGLVLRSEARKESTYLAAYPKGTKVTVTAENVSNADGYNWDAVIVNGKSGYMANAYLS